MTKNDVHFFFLHFVLFLASLKIEKSAVAASDIVVDGHTTLAEKLPMALLVCCKFYYNNST